MSSTHSRQQTAEKPFRVLLVTGVYPTEQKPHSGTFIKSQVDSLIAAGLEIELLLPKPGPSLVRYLEATMQVFLKTLTGGFDIVHGHYGLWCLTARLQWTTPVVASFMGDDLLGTVTADGGYSNKGAVVAGISRYLCRRVNAVIVKTEGMKEAASRGDNIVVIPNGVDFELFRPIPRTEARAALGWDQDCYYVLFGNDPRIPVKNYPLAQAAIERLYAKGIAAELVVANGLPQTKVVQYMNASNALILTSIAEGSPNVVKEAMSCNVPVVATNVGDVAQVIGKTKGCSVCPSDPDVIATALEDAFRHTEPTTGRTDIAHLDSAVIVKQILALYEQATRKKIKHK